MWACSFKSANHILVWQVRNALLNTKVGIRNYIRQRHWILWWQIRYWKPRTRKVTLLDISKAFDSINHSELLARFQILGVSAAALEWFRSYLSERMKYVRIGSKTLSTPTDDFRSIKASRWSHRGTLFVKSNRLFIDYLCTPILWTPFIILFMQSFSCCLI